MAASWRRTLRPLQISLCAAAVALAAPLADAAAVVVHSGLPHTVSADATLSIAAQRRGAGAVTGLRALQAVWATAVQADDAARLQAINDFFNQRIAFRDDMAVWGQVDYWASPFEFLEKGEGDCEDFAIAKYFSLLVAGVPVHKLRLVYVRAQLDGPSTPAAMRPTAQGQATAQPQAHMVLAYYASPDAEPLILDNLEPEVRLASRRADLTPVFSFNSQGLWQGPGLQRVSDPAAGLSRWRDVMAKARAEGFGR